MNKQVLLIDDDEDEEEFFRTAVNSLNTDIIFAAIHDSEIAFKELRRPEIILPNVIFVDINMPRFNGWEFLSELKKDKRLQQIPVVMYSTSTHVNDANRAVYLGALAFWTKPYRYTELAARLENLIKSL
ncbi:MAG: response regulator [Bacteroidota bacterium]|nr:response regulator [Bacteroidota bacterium]